ncbi:MAG: D-cysteine desulfhydrase family protein [Halieaceae bacterium]|nr:MAG: D-cysteine desulfhydrase family protein [Halieaceae bacterium]
MARIPTPLQFLSRASDKWGAGKRLWMKRDDLTGSALTGNKVRKLEFIAAHALEHGFQTLVTCGGVQSNHCRATALVAAQLGLDCHLVLRADDEPEQNTGNFLLDQLAGATFEILPAKEWATQLKTIYARRESEFSEAGRPALMIPTGGSDSLGVWGYIAATEELQSDLDDHGIERAALTLATGSAGTQTGLTAGVAMLDLPIDVVAYAVCDDADWFNRRVAADWQTSLARWPQLPRIDLVPKTRDHSVGPGYGQADAPVYELIAELTRLEGIVLDPVYTGKAFHGLLADLREGFYRDVDDIIFVHTGGVFGLFAHEPQLMSAASGAS